MITRRRGRAISNTQVQPLEVEVVDVEADEEIPSPSVEFLPDDIDAAGIELEDLFGIEDLKWTFDKDATSPFFNIEMSSLGVCGAIDQDSGFEASTASSPERSSSEPKIKNRRSDSSQLINKNAIAARMNRLKKKEYVSSLEKKAVVLTTENTVLKQQNSQLCKRVEELEDETRGPTRTTTTMPYPGNV